MKVTINNKKYNMPEWNFGNIMRLEEVGGFSAIELNSKKLLSNYFTILTAFIAVTTDNDFDEAARLAEQHILGGGSTKELVKEFVSSLTGSDFFKKMQENEEKAPEPAEG